MQMAALLKLCSEKKKKSVPELKLKRLRQQLAEVRAAHEKCAVDKLAAENAVAVR